MNGQFDSRTPPVSEGEVLDVDIEAVGSKGDGIAKKEGFVIFVPETNEGDRVKIKVTKVLRKVGFGEVVGESESQDEQETEETETQEEEPAQEETTEETEDSEEEEKKEKYEPSEGVQDTEDFGEDLEED